MEEKEFVELVERLEGFAHRNPGAYRFRVAMLAVLGYAFLIAVVLAVLFFVGVVVYYARLNVVVVKFLLVPLGIAGIVPRSMWVDFPAPDGQELRYEDAPRLFDLAKSTREATNGPELHKILLDDEFNAGIVQRPRLGMFGWHENYLIVGLPLLRGLSPDEVRAVIAHEFGHLSGKHGAFSAWIYRVRQTWQNLLQRIHQEDRWGSVIFEKFFAWYAPYFASYSFVLARSREYEADRSAVALSGKENTARALIKLELRDKAMTEEFWPSFFDRAGADALPPKETFSEMLTVMGQPLPPEKVQKWFSQSLTLRHSITDTHPALADRLEAIGYTDVRNTEDVGSFLKAEDQRADEYFLQSVSPDFIDSKNRLWRDDLKAAWRERHDFIREARQSLAKLEEKAKTEELTLEDRWERARLVRGTDGAAASLPLIKEILTINPDHAGANYNIGEALLEEGDEAGIQYIERAMDGEPQAIPYGCDLIIQFLVSRKRPEETEAYRLRGNDYFQKIELAQQERNSASTGDDFKYHDLSPEVLSKLSDRLRNSPDLAVAYLVQKGCEYFPQQPSYVLGVITERLTMYGGRTEGDSERLVNQIANEVTFPGSTFIIALEKDYKPLHKIFEGIQGSEIYRAESYRAKAP